MSARLPTTAHLATHGTTGTPAAANMTAVVAAAVAVAVAVAAVVAVAVALSQSAVIDRAIP